MTRKSKSGTTWTDAQYAAAGYSRLSIRPSVEDRQILDELAAETGRSVTETICRLARAEKKRRENRAAKKSSC